MIRRNGAPLLISTVRSPESVAARPPRVAPTRHVSLGTGSIAPTRSMATCGSSRLPMRRSYMLASLPSSLDLNRDAQTVLGAMASRPARGMKPRLGAVALLAMLVMVAAACQPPVGFGKSTLAGATLTRPTALEFGPDGRLYVAQLSGTLKA